MSESHGGAPIRIDLQTPEWAAQSTLDAPKDPAPIDIWLPFLQRLASASAQSAQEAAERAGKRVSCKKGCGACCRQLVVISLVEARALARLVAEMPEPRQSEIRARFADAVRRLEESGVLEGDILGDQKAAEFPLVETVEQRRSAAWFSLGIACPFLENESCGIHQSRPLVCREYQVTSPSERCSRLFREPVERIEMSVHLGQSLARAIAKITGTSVAMIPLAMALHWSAKIDAALSGRHDAVEMLKVLLGEIGDWRIER
jgi:Fe-S-cluster containining protein